MTYYELKRLLSKPSTKVLCIIPIIVVFFLVMLAVDYGDWVNSDGTHTQGIMAIRKLKEAKEVWNGMLTEDRIAEVIVKNKELKNNYVALQGFMDIRQLINYSFSEFREYDFETIDQLSSWNAQDFYSNRVEKLTTWLNGEGSEFYNEKEKNYIIAKYEAMNYPLKYEYADGWIRAKDNIAVAIAATVLINCLIVSNIFASEKQYREDSIYFSSFYGKNKGIHAKIIAGMIFSSVLYSCVLCIYTSAILSIYGTSGAECLIQASPRSWKSMYNITNIQEYALCLCGGYILCVFMSMLTMYVSAVTTSAVISLFVSYSVLFVAPVLGTLPGMPSDIVGLLPDQLLVVHDKILQMQVYCIGDTVLQPISILFVLYLLLTIVLYLLTYRTFKYKKLK